MSETLTDFLLARIAEDEAVARKFDQELVRDFGAPAATLLSSDLTLAGSGYMDYPVLTIDSTRVLAECEAKRRIIEAHPLVTDSERLVPVWTGSTPGVACENCGGNPVDEASPLEDIGPCETLLALALPYADHPDYREEWKP